MRSRRSLELLSFVLPLTLYALTLDWRITTNGMDASILYLQYSILVHHALTLPPGSEVVDVSLYQGRVYSALSPGYAVLSLPFAALGFQLNGWRFTLFGPPRVMDELFSSLMTSLASLICFRISSELADERRALLTALALSLSTPLWVYATTLIPQSASLPLALAAVYFTLRGEVRRAGLALGASTFVEYASSLFLLPLVIYTWAKGGWRKAAQIPAAFTPGVMGQLVYNYLLFHNPLLFPQEFFQGSPGPLWGDFSLRAVPFHLLLNLLSPYRGILLTSPLLFLGTLGIREMFRLDRRAEAALFLCSSAEVILFYSAWKYWDGGLGYSQRFAALALPLLLIPSCLSWGKALRGLAILGSTLNSAVAFTSPYPPQGGPLYFQPFSAFPGLLHPDGWIALLTPHSSPVIYGTYLCLWAWSSLPFLLIRESGRGVKPDLREARELGEEQTENF